MTRATKKSEGASTEKKSSSRVTTSKVIGRTTKTAKSVVKHGVMTASEKLAAFGIDAICDMTADCIPQRTIAAKIGVSWATFTKWIDDDKGRTEQYAHARLAQADKMADDILAISDDGSNDTYETEDGTRTNQDVIARSRLRVDARKWLASKMAPKKYGDKLAIGGAEDLPPVALTADVKLDPSEAYLQMIGKK